MKIVFVLTAAAVLVSAVICISSVLAWKIIQKYTPGEIVVGQVRWIQKTKIPGFKQILFSYTKKGKPYEALSRPMWHKKKFRLKGMYKIQVFHRRIGKKGTAVWADPVSQNRIGK